MRLTKKLLNQSSLYTFLHFLDYQVGLKMDILCMNIVTLLPSADLKALIKDASLH